MNKVRVKLVVITHKFPTYAVDGGVTISLTKSGPPTSAVTASWQAATLELLELPGPGDKTTSERVLIKIPGFIQEQKGSPFFSTGNADIAAANLNPTDPTVMFKRPDSDFSLDLDWDTTTLQMPTIDLLRFPWESNDENFQHELGARLTIAGAVEADIKDNGTVNIRMKHKQVPEDGVAGGNPSDCEGFGVAYPRLNNNMKATNTVPFSGKTFNVFVHKDIGASVNASAANSHDFTKVTSAMKDILSSGGFTSNVNIVEVDWNDPRLAKIGTVSGTAPNQQLTMGSSALPWFDAWILLDRQTAWSQGIEAGRSEAGNYNVAAANKVLTKPITILDGALKGLVPTIDPAQMHIWLANLYVHEIGHGLGLNHGLDVDVKKGPPTSATYTKAKGSGTMTDLVINGKNVFLQRFGPVHSDVLKKNYAL